jgi:hypothetical protein
MASKSSKPPQINSQPAYTPDDDRAQERWKTRPSTEVTSDEGENAERDRQRAEEENTPGAGKGAAAPASRDPRPPRR